MLRARLEVGEAESALTLLTLRGKGGHSPGEELGVYSNNSGFQQKGLKSTGMMGPPPVSGAG